VLRSATTLSVRMESRGDRPLALAFGAVADTYDRVRPRYYFPALDRAQEVLELPRTARVLDLAAGTGRLTRELLWRFASVVAVEPDEEMRTLLRSGTVLAGEPPFSPQFVPNSQAHTACR